MKKQIISKAITEGLASLGRIQMPDGGFASFSSPSREKFTGEKMYRSSFPAALILSCLNEAGNARASIIKEKLARFLLAQKNENWSFNYWVRNAKESLEMPYPDDLDDTFCALAALSAYNPASIQAPALARIISLLTFMEETEGGPYRTWITPKNTPREWLDVDLAVNANIGYFLSLQDVDLPKIISFTEKAIDAEKYSSPYYPSAYQVVYFISRFYRGVKMEKIRAFLFQKQEKSGAFGNPLLTALAVSSLLRLGADPKKLEKSIAYVLRSQENGSWQADAFCLDPGVGGKTYYAGSSALTSAFCLEALALYEKTSAEAVSEQTRQGKTDRLRREVVRRAEKKFSFLDADLKKEGMNRLKKTLSGDKDGSIVLLPYFFADSLGMTGKKVSPDAIHSLCLANLYGWIAYTIYDDFLDDEGEPRLLSLANVCLRELTEIFFRIGEQSPDFLKIFTETMDKLDSANTWEVTHCRTKNTRAIPDYGNFARLADRSLGHALGPFALLCLLGFSKNSSEFRSARTFFKHYLIARQLNDDAHDWEEDVKQGHINAVGAELLRRLGKNALPDKFSKRDLRLMQKIFWNEAIPAIAGKILSSGTSARNSLKKMKTLRDTALFEKLLAPLERSANEALAEKERTLAFLKAFR